MHGMMLARMWCAPDVAELCPPSAAQAPSAPASVPASSNSVGRPCPRQSLLAGRATRQIKWQPSPQIVAGELTAALDVTRAGGPHPCMSQSREKTGPDVIARARLRGTTRLDRTLTRQPAVARALGLSALWSGLRSGSCSAILQCLRASRLSKPAGFTSRLGNRNAGCVRAAQ